MTWTAHCTVQDVGDGPAPIDVLAAANADEKVTLHGMEVAAVASNTEGMIRGVEVRLQLDEDETALKPGDILTIHGHFQGKS